MIFEGAKAVFWGIWWSQGSSQRCGKGEQFAHFTCWEWLAVFMPGWVLLTCWGQSDRELMRDLEWRSPRKRYLPNCVGGGQCGKGKSEWEVNTSPAQGSQHILSSGLKTWHILEWGLEYCTFLAADMKIPPRKKCTLGNITLTTPLGVTESPEFGQAKTQLWEARQLCLIEDDVWGRGRRWRKVPERLQNRLQLSKCLVGRGFCFVLCCVVFVFETNEGGHLAVEQIKDV